MSAWDQAPVVSPTAKPKAAAWDSAPLAQPAPAPTPRKRQLNPIDNFTAPIVGAYENLVRNASAKPQVGRASTAGADLMALASSPFVGAQNVFTKPLAEAVNATGAQAYEPVSTARGVSSIASGRGVPRPQAVNGDQAVNLLNDAIGSSLAGAMPGRTAVGRVGPQNPQRSISLGARAAPSAARASPSREYAKTLDSIGVQTNLPQRMGPGFKSAEDLAARTPVVGQAITGSRMRQVEQLNRGIALKALEPVGGTVPKNVRPGFDMVRHVDDELSKVYNRAIDMVPSPVPDQQLTQDFADIAQQSIDLTDESASLYDRAVSNRLNRLQQPDLTGQKVKDIHSELGQLQAAAAKKGDDTLASMFGDARQAVMGLIKRADPVAGELVDKADQGWSIYKIMNKAAAQASNRGGVFLPGQLNTQVRNAANMRGVNMAGKGQGPLQDISTAASSLIPDSYGNPGTANALMQMGGAGGFGALAVSNPVAAAGAAAAVGGAATPYLLSSRKVLEVLPESASIIDAGVASADELSNVVSLAERSRQIGRPAPKKVRQFVTRVTGALGPDHPASQSLLQLASPTKAAAGQQQSGDEPTTATGDMSVADWLAAQQQDQPSTPPR